MKERDPINGRSNKEQQTKVEIYVDGLMADGAIYYVKSEYIHGQLHVQNTHDQEDLKILMKN